MPLIEKALQFAMEAHRGQIRKFDGVAYIKHPLSVMGILTEFYTEQEVLASAILHDTVEDCEDITLEVIHERFAEIVAGYVFYVSEKSQKADGNRKIRKEIDREHYAKGTKVSQDIKIADMLDNIPTIALYTPEFALMYLDEKLQLLGALKKCTPALKVRAIKMIYDMFTFLNK
jgi:(p)ppGpp synthase/HD superfamily hydrolase